MGRLTTAIRHPLVAQQLAVVAVLVVFTVTPDEIKSRFDPYLLLGIGTVYVLCLVVMLLYTRQWTSRGSGIFSTLEGDATLYVASGLLGLGVVFDAHHYVDLARSCFVVGGITLFVATLLYVREKRRERNQIDIDYTKGLP